MKLRVAMVSEHANPMAPLGSPDAGGQNVYVDALARHLARLGVAVDVYTRRDDPAVPDVVHAEPGVQVHHVRAGPPSRIPKDELFALMPEFAERLGESWRWRRPDIVHAHYWMSGWAAQQAGPASTPLIQTFHALGCVKRRHQGDADTSPVEREPVERALVADADVIIATCEDEVAELVRFGGSTSRITVVPCGVDGLFTPRRRGRLVRRRLQRRRVVCVSRMVPRKGIGDLVRALVRLPADVELVVAGGPPLDRIDEDPEIQRLRELATRIGVVERCRFVGSLDRAEVAALLRSADVVACTPWYEPFGIVPVEAMACGVPVVGTRVGGLRDTIEDGVNGLLVPPRRPDEIATAIGTLLADPARRRALGAAGARRADRLYRWPTVARAVLSVYSGALSARLAPTAVTA
jgi:glycosyltransferase involved in cell wall biosynthesis